MYPDQAGAILLEDPPAWWVPRPPTELDAERQAQMRGRIIELKRKTREEMIAGRARPISQLVRSRTRTLGRCQAAVQLQRAFNRLGPAAVDWQATYAASLVRAAHHGGSRAGRDRHRGKFKRDPGARATVAHHAYPGAGHNIRREQFDRYINVVRTFLAEVTACLS